MLCLVLWRDVTFFEFSHLCVSISPSRVVSHCLKLLLVSYFRCVSLVVRFFSNSTSRQCVVSLGCPVQCQACQFCDSFFVDSCVWSSPVHFFPAITMNDIFHSTWRRNETDNDVFRSFSILHYMHVVMSPTEDVRTREEPTVRYTKVIKRRVLKKQARKVRTSHLKKCSLILDKKKAFRKSLIKFYDEGRFIEYQED